MYWVLEKPNLGLVSYSFLGLDFFISNMFWVYLVVNESL